MNIVPKFLRENVSPRGPFPRWLVNLGLLSASAALFLELAGDVWLKEGFSWDAPMMLTIHRYSRPWINTVMLAITWTGSGIGIALAVLVAVGFMWRRRRREGVTLALSLIGASALNGVLKVVFGRPRPEIFPPLVFEHTYSFPSGHTTAGVAFYGLLAIFLWRSGRWGWALSSGLWPFLIAFSRIYLGVHYPSDVLASLSLASGWLAALILSFDRYHNVALGG